MGRLPTRQLPRLGCAVSEIGHGTASVGNLYKPVSDAEARAALDAALDGGIRYFDTAPHYGHGLSERRVGDALRGRSDVVLSTKVGRLLKPVPAFSGSDAARHDFRSPLPFDRVFDYTREGILRSWEDSLQRLGLAQVDLLFVHDIGRFTHGPDHERRLAQLLEGGGLDALVELRRAGAIAGFGLGVNEWEICLELMDRADLDVILLAGRYTLLEQTALDAFLPRCRERGTAVVIGGAYNSGILATGTRSSGPLLYDYGKAPPALVARVQAIEAVCDQFDVPLAAAALQFPLAHPAVASVIPGMASASRVAQTLALHARHIPGAFWRTLQDKGLLRPDAPVPPGRDP
ncbi:MAG: hypothetical protein RLZZ200_5 [Pseudomonadota bacterium]|jgi:D-threo-aldose 1-dehydrogenase